MLSIVSFQELKLQKYSWDISLDHPPFFYTQLAPFMLASPILVSLKTLPNYSRRVAHSRCADIRSTDLKE